MAILTILMRHANTKSEGVHQILSESGRKMQAKVNAYLKAMGIEPTQIWTSPILRAKQTAEMIGQEFGITPQEEWALSDDLFDEIETSNRLFEMPDESTIILVSHAPQIMRLSTYFMGGQVFGATPPTSSAAFIEFQGKVKPGKGRFIRLVTYSDIS